MADKIAIISLVVSLLVAVFTIYLQFFQGARLVGSFSRVDLLPASKGQRTKVFGELIIKEIQTKPDSKIYKDFLATYPKVPELMESNRIDEAQRLIEQLLIDGLPFAGPLDLLQKFIGSASFPIIFNIPITIANNGANAGIVSSLVLRVTDKNNPKARWAFICTYEINDTKILPIGDGRPRTDVDKLERPFAGIAVPPKDSVNINAYFAPVYKAYSIPISNGGLKLGTYNMEVLGYDSLNNELFVTAKREYEFSEEYFLNSVLGNYNSNASIEPIIKAFDLKRE